jgi:hypothetical protein
MEELPVLVSVVESVDERTKAIFRPDAEVLLEYIPAERLRESLSKLCGGLSKIFSDIKAVGNFRLQEVTVQVEITAEGGISLIGTASVGGKGAITLKFVE